MSASLQSRCQIFPRPNCHDISTLRFLAQKHEGISGSEEVLKNLERTRIEEARNRDAPTLLPGGGWVRGAPDDGFGGKQL